MLIDQLIKVLGKEPLKRSTNKCLYVVRANPGEICEPPRCIQLLCNDENGIATFTAFSGITVKEEEAMNVLHFFMLINEKEPCGTFILLPADEGIFVPACTCHLLSQENDKYSDDTLECAASSICMAMGDAEPMIDLVADGAITPLVAYRYLDEFYRENAQVSKERGSVS